MSKIKAEAIASALEAKFEREKGEELEDLYSKLNYEV